MRVRYEHSSTATGVGDHGRRSLITKSFDILFSQQPSAVQVSRMRMQSSAAHLTCRRSSYASVLLQHASCRVIDACKQSFGNAAFEQKYVLTAFAIIDRATSVEIEGGLRALKQRQA